MALPAHFIGTLAAMMFYDEKGLKVSFEKITEDERKPYIERAQKVVVFMDKLNLEPRPRQDEAKAAERERAREDAVRRIIGEFVKGLKHPKDVARFFPCEELARRIIQNGY